ncbi:MAG TPA: hypothetical protein VGA13_11190 [Acidimicrobiales bacterium]|jgi:hypothetical protein
MGDDTTVSCSQCGTVLDGGPDDAATQGWSMGVEATGRVTWECGACTRRHVRDIESKLPEEFWA